MEINETTFRNILTFLDRLPLTGTEAAALCEAKAAIQFTLDLAAEQPQPPTDNDRGGGGGGGAECRC